MVSVVSNSRGTANHILGAFSRNNRVGIAGKTGTAETGLGPPHSWFAGYTYNNRHNKPEIAVAVLVESIGEGSEYAAPIFKRVMEIYFNGSPRTIYPWEVEIGVRRTPTPEPTATPIPLPTETPTPEQTQEQIPEPAPTETPVPEPVAEETPQP
jgi:membrane peptidoglycan carboxypeptidase